jgi:sulfatase maturation enzyme AslB (radical SAM superfamily)
MQTRSNVRIPKRVSIETIYGCNASCIMCPIDIESARKKGVMPIETSQYVFEELAPYVHEIEKLDLFGLGEPLLDPHLMTRIRHAKSLGFRSIAISTNAELLTSAKQEGLLESGIDTVIFSIDGIQAETHESIRRKLHFKKVLENCESMIRRRDLGNHPTRFVLRFIRQTANLSEWPGFVDYWSNRLSAERNDLIIGYDAHSWSGAVTSKEAHLQDVARDPYLEALSCWHVFDHLVVLADGTVPLCSEDWHMAKVNFGNVNRTSPVEIFNSSKFDRIRALHAAGTKTRIQLCSECTIHYSGRTKTVILPRTQRAIAAAN